MAKIIDTNVSRKNYQFKVKIIVLSDEEGHRTSFPAIVLYEKYTNIPVKLTGFEMWLVNLSYSKCLDGATLIKKAYNVCSFLNYVLWNQPQLNHICDIDIDIIRKFMMFYKIKDNDEQRNPDTWKRCLDDILKFLSNYYCSFKNKLDFKCQFDSLDKVKIVSDYRSGKRIVVHEKAGLNLKAPDNKRKKNRVIFYSHLDILLFEAKKHAPLLVLPIMLQAYAGLREGEVTSLTVGSIREITGAFNSVSGIEIDLLSQAEFSVNCTQKVKVASIKKNRIQKVYPDFIDKVHKAYDEHLKILEKILPNGERITKDTPLLFNHYKKLMTTTTYSNHVKNLFYKYFVPSLISLSREQGLYEENLVYIERYEEEYPGAHMFRHWFTMYLLTKKKLPILEIMKWRGDSNITSMEDYISENEDMINAYQNVAYIYQDSILGGHDDFK